MDEWQSRIDEQLKKALESPEWQNLPGQGKPLNLNQDPHTPPEMRLAYKMMKDNGFAPDWIEESKALDTLRETLYAQIEKQANRSAALQTAIDTYNKRVLSYNLKAPAGIPHKRRIE